MSFSDRLTRALSLHEDQQNSHPTHGAGKVVVPWPVVMRAYNSFGAMINRLKGGVSGVVTEINASGHRLGYHDGAPGRTADDLALTRMPAGVPADMLETVRKKFGIGGSGKFCLKVKKSSQDVKFDKLDIGDLQVYVDEKDNKSYAHPVWEKEDILNACWEIISNIAGAYSAENWAGHKGSTSNFEDLAQNGATGAWVAINSGQDRGDPFLKWIKARIRSHVSAGSGRDQYAKSASGFWQELLRVNSLDALEALIDGQKHGIDEKLVADPSKRKDRKCTLRGIQYGDYVDDLWDDAARLSEILFKLENPSAVDDGDIVDDAAKTPKEEFREFKNEIKDKIANLKDTKGMKILGARTGLYDPISTPHSDNAAKRYLMELLKVETMEEFQALKMPKDLSKNLNAHVTGMAYKYKQALEAGGGYHLEGVRVKIRDWMEAHGSRDVFHDRRGIESDKQKSPDTGEEFENPSMPKHDDSFTELTDYKEVVSNLLKAGIDGVKIEYNDEGHTNVHQLLPQDLRILYRFFGLRDYPYKYTHKDPEIDFDLFDQYMDAFEASLEDKDNQDIAVQVKPIDAKEKAWLLDISSQSMAINIAGHMDYDIYRDAKEGMEKFMKMTDEITIIPHDMDTAERLALHLASSRWIRRGCPPMSPPSIAKELGIKKVDDKLAGLIGKYGWLDYQKGDGVRPELGPNDKIPKLYRIGQAIRKRIGVDKLDRFNPRKGRSDEVQDRELTSRDKPNELEAALASGQDIDDIIGAWAKEAQEQAIEIETTNKGYDDENDESVDESVEWFADKKIGQIIVCSALDNLLAIVEHYVNDVVNEGLDEIDTALINGAHAGLKRTFRNLLKQTIPARYIR